MKHFLIISINYENETPNKMLEKVVELFDKKKEVDLTSDDFVTILPESNKSKSIAINLNYDSKDFKTAVFETLVKANKIGTGWKVQGPVNIKGYMFMLNIDKKSSKDLPLGINGISIILNKKNNHI